MTSRCFATTHLRLRSHSSMLSGHNLIRRSLLPATRSSFSGEQSLGCATLTVHGGRNGAWSGGWYLHPWGFSKMGALSRTRGPAHDQSSTRDNRCALFLIAAHPAGFP